MLDQLALERMLAQALDRRYQAGLMPVGSRIKQEATAAWKSAIWRRSIAATERAWRSCWPLTSAAWTQSHATVVGDLLAGLRDRGLDVSRPILVVIDGAKAPLRAVNDMFDHPIVRRWASRAEVNPGQATDGEPAS